MLFVNIVTEHSHVTSDVLWVFLTYLSTCPNQILLRRLKLKSLLNGKSDKSKILNNIRKYNCAFEMTSKLLHIESIEINQTTDIIMDKWQAQHAGK